MFLRVSDLSGFALPSTRFSRVSVLAGIAAAAFLISADVSAFSINTDNPDVRMSWDNTFKYSAAWRQDDQDPDVLAAYNPNLDDGDRNFDKGLISNRLDWFTQFDLSYRKKYGLRVTGAAWYDDVYQKSTDNDGTGLSNNLAGGPTEFPDGTKDLHGQDSEILDAFVYSNMDIGDKGLSLKLGRYSKIYGESLFFGGNGIAGAQAPIDIVKLISVPGSTFQEIIRPVGQLGATMVIDSNLSVGAYYQYEWERSVLPGSGSYFSFADFVDEGGENTFVPPAVGGLLTRLDDIEPSDTGQYGVSLSIKTDEYDFGVYAAQFHDKFAQFYWRPGPGGGYALVFGEDIKTVGASVSTSFTDTNVAAEISFRDNMPLAGVGNVIIDPTRIGDGGDNALFPVAETFHAQVSMISVLKESSLWDGGTLLAEIAYNSVESIDKNEDQLDPNTSKSATALRLLFEPEFFQVASGLDLKVPVGIGYGISGNTAINGTGLPPDGTGDVTIGVKFDYQRVWSGGIQLTHYVGDAGGIVDQLGQLSGNQVYADRDFISINIKRSF